MEWLILALIFSWSGVCTVLLYLNDRGWRKFYKETIEKESKWLQERKQHLEKIITLLDRTEGQGDKK